MFAVRQFLGAFICFVVFLGSMNARANQVSWEIFNSSDHPCDTICWAKDKSRLGDWSIVASPIGDGQSGQTYFGHNLPISPYVSIKDDKKGTRLNRWGEVNADATAYIYYDGNDAADTSISYIANFSETGASFKIHLSASSSAVGHAGAGESRAHLLGTAVHYYLPEPTTVSFSNNTSGEIAASGPNYWAVLSASARSSFTGFGIFSSEGISLASAGMEKISTPSLSQWVLPGKYLITFSQSVGTFAKIPPTYDTFKASASARISGHAQFTFNSSCDNSEGKYLNEKGVCVRSFDPEWKLLDEIGIAVEGFFEQLAHCFSNKLSCYREWRFKRDQLKQDQREEFCSGIGYKSHNIDRCPYVDPENIIIGPPSKLDVFSMVYSFFDRYSKNKHGIGFDEVTIEAAPIIREHITNSLVKDTLLECLYFPRPSADGAVLKACGGMLQEQSPAYLQLPYKLEQIGGSEYQLLPLIFLSKGDGDSLTIWNSHGLLWASDHQSIQTGELVFAKIESSKLATGVEENLVYLITSDGIADTSVYIPGYEFTTRYLAKELGLDFVFEETGIDSDNDGVMNADDNCPWMANQEQRDGDSDTVGDACDAFPTDPAESKDTDGDGIGDKADPFPVGHFSDVSPSSNAYHLIESLVDKGITAGCAKGSFCPASGVTRSDIAVLLTKAHYGGGYSPSPATGLVFSDVDQNDIAAAFIENLYSDGMALTCGDSKYCPLHVITRDQAAVFLLLFKYGAGYAPSEPTGMFKDVPVNHWAAAWIEELASLGITMGCGADNYCPSQVVTREQLAIFLARLLGI